MRTYYSTYYSRMIFIDQVPDNNINGLARNHYMTDIQESVKKLGIAKPTRKQKVSCHRKKNETSTIAVNIGK